MQLGDPHPEHPPLFFLCFFFISVSLFAFPLPSFLPRPPPQSLFSLFLAAYYENTILEYVVGFLPWGLRWNFKSLTIIQL